uniref:ATP-dependent Clp protease proteolytic subunit n=1 Tax=Opuntia streptacantha TaxID=393608 RepID=A0A7C8Z5H5_OPUST|nr:clp protease proteolytic subunit [Opuntia ficus-indica]WRH31608.1 clp protease proteolytic subunit [Opuntia ficus-indica]
MPVGVPKVLVSLPDEEEEEEPTWVELYSEFSHRGVLFLCRELEEESANQITGLIIYLSMEDNTRELYLFINSIGGSLMYGMAMHSVIRYVPTDVNTICLGIAASVASYILLAGTKEKRFAFPHSRIMIHQPSGSITEGNVTHLVNESTELLNLRITLTRVYAELTGKPFSVLWADMERDFYMSAEEAKDYGIIDSIGLPPGW